jgi:hypothetical protein
MIYFIFDVILIHAQKRHPWKGAAPDRQKEGIR